MPIIEKDPWREQYFQGVACPDQVIIPTDDGVSYRLYPDYRWVYNKLLICETQGLEHGPHGFDPKRFPVFSKPIYNMRGMSVGGRIINSEKEYDRAQQPGYLWMPLCQGEHVSTDVAVIDAAPRWWRHTVGKPLEKGTFDYWTVLADRKPELETYLTDWMGRNLRGFTGVLNFETIGGTIIECHLRMSDQWVDLYGPGWVESVVELYLHGRWNYADNPRVTGYSVVLFGAHGQRYQIETSAVDELRRRPGVSSIQITFHQDKPPEYHAMPPGGFRLAIVNCHDLNLGFQIREELALLFWTVQKLHRPAPRNNAATKSG